MESKAADHASIRAIQIALREIVIKKRSAGSPLGSATMKRPYDPPDVPYMDGDRLSNYWVWSQGRQGRRRRGRGAWVAPELPGSDSMYRVHKMFVRECERRTKVFDPGSLSQPPLTPLHPARSPQEEHEYLYIQTLTLGKDEQVAVIGDIHGGLCNLRNVLKRLKASGWFKEGVHNGFDLKRGRRIISLGDLVDRGPRSLEVVHLMLALKMQDGNWDKVLIVNGNHEDYEMYSETFENEYQSHLSCLPAAIFARFGLQGKWVQFCHGGIDESLSGDIKCRLDSVRSHPNAVAHQDDVWLQIHRRSGDLSGSGLKWSDFHYSSDSDEDGHRGGGTTPKASNTRRCYKRSVERGGGVRSYNQRCTNRYLKQMGVACIVRGHQDFVNGHMVLPRGSNRGSKGTPPNVRFQAYVFPTANARHYIRDGAKSTSWNAECEMKAVRSMNRAVVKTLTSWSDVAGDWVGECWDATRGITLNNAHEESLKLRVPRKRCQWLIQMFKGTSDASKAMRANGMVHEFTDRHVTVVTTTNAQEARELFVESFLVVSQYIL